MISRAARVGDAPANPYTLFTVTLKHVCLRCLQVTTICVGIHDAISGARRLCRVDAGERPHHAIAAFALEIEPGIKSRTNFALFGVIATSRFQPSRTRVQTPGEPHDMPGFVVSP
jgi:hypothetical protein